LFRLELSCWSHIFVSFLGLVIAIILAYIFVSMFLLESPPPEHFRRQFQERKKKNEKQAPMADAFAFSKEGNSKKDD
jgi:hypothetical protein